MVVIHWFLWSACGSGKDSVPQITFNGPSISVFVCLSEFPMSRLIDGCVLKGFNAHTSAKSWLKNNRTEF